MQDKLDPARDSKRQRSIQPPQGTFAAHLERARAGDRDAAVRVLTLCSESLSELALAQNGGLIDPLLAQFLCAELKAISTGSASALSALVTSRKKGRPRSIDLSNSKFWFTVGVLRRVDARGLSVEKAIEDELAGTHDADGTKRSAPDPWPAVGWSEDSAAKAYKGWRAAAIDHLAQLRAEAEEGAVDTIANLWPAGVRLRLTLRAKRQGKK